jgi:hypothetical protein
VTPVSLEAWAIRWGLPPEALAELRTLAHQAAAPHPDDPPPGQSEAWAQSAIRLEAARKGIYLWRNNVGALQDDTGRLVRYGLANDSAPVNKRLKSSDLIGLRPFVIQPEHVGRLFGQFVAREVKEPGWTYRGDDRERAQQTFIHLVQTNGGDAAFATGPGSL